MWWGVTGAGGVAPCAAARPAEKNTAPNTINSKPLPRITRISRRKYKTTVPKPWPLVFLKNLFPIRDNSRFCVGEIDSWPGLCILGSRHSHRRSAGHPPPRFGRVGPGGDQRPH